MATFLRPAVRISQTTTPSAPVSASPALVPCVVGPCYQIIGPLTAAGTLDPQARILQPARIISDTDLSEPLACAGKKFQVSVGGASPVVITLPLPLGGRGLSFAVVKQALNKVLAAQGAYADFIANRLVLATLATGDAASIELQAPPSDTAYTVFHVPTTKVTGADGYINQAVTIPFSGLPATKTPIKNLVFDAAFLDAYKVYGGRLVRLSTVSAPSWNANSFGKVTWRGASLSGVLVGGTAAVALQPLASSGASLVAPGKTYSNTVFSNGTAAKVSIPLGYSYGDASDTVKFPDAPNGNRLDVSTFLPSAVLAANGALSGTYVGDAGNQVAVTIEVGGSTTFLFADDVLAITLESGISFADFKSALESADSSSWAQYLSIGLTFDEANDKLTPVLGGDDSAFASAISFPLSGGSDPTDFSPAWSGANRRASVLGAVDVAGTTLTALGLIGKKLQISLDGRPFVDVAFATDALTDQIDAALNAAYSTSVVYAGTVGVRVAGPLGMGTTATALRITANIPDGNTWQDSTIQVRSADPVVMQRLFGGVASTRTVTGLTASPDAGKRKLTVAASAYNSTTLSGSFERALVPGANTVTLRGAFASAALVLVPDQAACAALVAADYAVTLNGDALTVDCSGNSGHTYAGFLTALQAGLTTAKATVGRLTLHGQECLVIAAPNGVAGLHFTAIDADLCPGLFGQGTVPTFASAAYVGGATNVTVQDSGNRAACRVVSVDNLLTNAGFDPAIGFVTTDPADLTAYFFNTLTDTTTAPKGLVKLTHSSGQFKFVTSGDLNATEASKVGTTLLIKGTTTVDVSWRQQYASAASQRVLDYGIVFQGGTCPVLPGDLLQNDGSPVGLVSRVTDLAIPGKVFTNAQLSLVEATARGELANWSIEARGLDVQTTRPIAPELQVSLLAGTLTLKGALNRDTSGIASGSQPSTLYAGYRALRKDVTAADGKPMLLAFNDADEIERLIGPSTPDNPLAFGLKLASGAAAGIKVSGLGVAAVSADAPYGTPEAYDSAFEFLKRNEIYTLATLTNARAVGLASGRHCAEMSNDSNNPALAGGRERRALINLPIPTELESLHRISGDMTIEETEPGTYELTFADPTNSVTAALAGVKDANGSALNLSALTAENGVWLDRAGDAYRYLITQVLSPTTVQIVTYYPFDAGEGPGTGGNDDHFYKTDGAALVDFSPAGELCTISVRQPAIDLSTSAGKAQACAALAAFADGVLSKSLMCIMPSEIVVDVAGTPTVVPGFYASCVWAGLTASQPIKQGFTNFPLPGIMGVIGSSDTFTDEQMASASGVNWLVQDSDGAPVVSRFQLTTDTTSLETMEWSIVKTVDFIAKAFRSLLHVYLGRYEIDPGTLDAINYACSALAGQLSGTVAAQVTISNLLNNPATPNRLGAQLRVKPFYPIDGIDLTVVAGI